MRDAIGAVEDALRSAAIGEASFPLRTMVRTSGDILGAMPGAIGGAHPALGAKLVTVFNGNAARGQHTHQAVIALFSSETGEPLALLDGRYITEIRTAAASAVATRALSGDEPAVAAIIGTGVQARAHAEALRTISSIQEIRVWGRAAAKTREFAGSQAGSVMLTPHSTVADACRGAQVICTVTASDKPILSAADVPAGAHVNAVGSCSPRTRELAADLVARARLVCDSREGAANEAGDFLLAIKDGALRDLSEVLVLGDVLAGKADGRSRREDTTIFESLGVGVEDVACAQIVYDRAIARGVGVTVEL